MLEFIVLGEIPGTHLKIGFTALLWAVFGVVVGLLAYQELQIRRKVKTKQQSTKELAL